MRNYLDFEAPIKELDEQIQKLKDSAVKSGVNVDNAVAELEKALVAKTTEIYQNLDPWQKVQLSRHPDRPYALEYIEKMTEENSTKPTTIPKETIETVEEEFFDDMQEF